MRLIFEVVGSKKGGKRPVRLEVFNWQYDAEVGLRRLRNNPKYQDWTLSIRKNIATDLEPQTNSRLKKLAVFLFFQFTGFPVEYLEYSLL